MGMFFGHNQNRNINGYGYLYNFDAVSNALFAPTDWKVPEDSDWDALITYLGGAAVAGGTLKELGFNHWLTPNTGADNSSGFTAWGGGYIGNNGAPFSFNELCFFWSQTAAGSDAYDYYLEYNTDNITKQTNSLLNQGNSVRLIWSGAGTPASTMTDYDGNVYDVIQVDTQYWIKQNWKCTKLNDGSPLTLIESEAAWSITGSLFYAAFDYNPEYV